MIAFHFPLISGLADGFCRTNVVFGLTIKLELNINLKLNWEKKLSLRNQ